MSFGPLQIAIYPTVQFGRSEEPPNKEQGLPQANAYLVLYLNLNLTLTRGTIFFVFPRRFIELHFSLRILLSSDQITSTLYFCTGNHVPVE